MVGMVVATPQSGIEHLTEISLAIGTVLRLRVFGAHNIITCIPLEVAGRRIVVQASEQVPDNACVKIECDDALMLGEAVASWQHGSNTYSVIILEQALVGLSRLRSLCSEWVSGED
jgi:hypothetical protein